MEQLYLLEIFIDKVAIFFNDQEDSGAKKGLITKVNFGPNVQLIIKEGQLSKTGEAPDDIITCDPDGKRKFTRTIRVGKSYLFPSFPDTVIASLSKFPLEIEVWNDDDTEDNNIFVGWGRMPWERIFFKKLKESTDPRLIYEALSVKQRTILWHECCCKPAAEVEFILRLTPLGGSIITEFQQPLNDPDSIVFRSNKSPSMFICKRKDGADPNFCMLGSIYESTTLEDPEIIKNATKKIEVCTELQSCGMGAKGNDYRCIHDKNEKKEEMKQYAIKQIRMGEISGPCGSVNCPLAHKVRGFIRNLDVYKNKAKNVKGTKDPSNKICGSCHCKDNREHRDTCPSRKPCEHPTCGLDGCGKVIKSVHDNVCRSLDETATKTDQSSDKSSNSSESDNGEKPADRETKTVAYVFSVNKVPNFMESKFGRDYTFKSLNATYNAYLTAGASKVKSDAGCCHRSVKVNTQDTEQNLELKYSMLGISNNKNDRRSCRSMPSMETAQFNSVSTPNLGLLEHRPSRYSMCANNQLIYNVTVTRQSNKYCLESTDDKDCKYGNLNSYLKSSISCVNIGGGCCCRPMPNMNAAQETQVFNSASIPNQRSAEPKPRSMGTNNPLIYNVTEVKQPHQYCLQITDDKDCKCRQLNSYLNSGISCVKTGGGCCCRPMANMNAAPTNIPNLGPPEYRPSTRSMGANNPLIYNVLEVKSNKYCLEVTDDKDCKCTPKKPAPPCRTFDCDCLQETVNIASRKKHMPFCPQFKHKSACPVNTMFDDEEKKVEEDEDAVEPLPYGLPPIKLGPCPVMGRPCSVPDGFARMYKNAALARPPPSQGVSGKVCCSEEYERIKTAIKEYMKRDKDHDLRCVNVFNIDTERRCCDKDQVLLALMGKTCCGTHKLALQEKFKEDPKKK